MRNKRVLMPVLACFVLPVFSQVNVDVNMNIKHSVDGVSDFGRERHITVHSSLSERDWSGEEDKLDYFINDLDVYFGRDNGSGGWKNQQVTEDPNKPNWPDAKSIETIGNGLREWYEGDDFKLRHQYEKSSNMIMGITPEPIYPTLNWGTRGNDAGCQTYDVDAAAFWIGEYLDHHFSKNESDMGEPLPKYWECINEPDMEMLGWGTMFLSSPEKLWEFHNLTAKEVRSRLGENAPKIGGMTWGLHDFYSQDGVARMDPQFYYDNSDAAMHPIYDNMLESNVWQDKGDKWFQWDAEYQGFIDSCGANMDFYSMHLYDWPADNNTGRVRCGGLIEASLDLMEWYDMYKFGTRKDIIISEFGSVSPYAHKLPYKRRDWEHLRPFNQMMMQFLERPSHIVLSMPFSPAKAQWGDFFNADGSLLERYIVTLMDPVGDYTETATKSRYDHEEWEWSGIILWYELWKDVKGTRIDTKADDRDIQVDAYVDGNHMYVILNNLEITEKDIDLHIFDDYTNVAKSVTITHQFLNESLGTHGLPVNDVNVMATAPSLVTLAASGTMILDYEFESDITIDQESKEIKYMCEPLTTAKTKFGGQLCHVDAGTSKQTANVNGVSVPTIGEATLRIGLQSFSADALTVSINGHEIASGSGNWRGRTGVDGIGGWFGVAEIDIPIEYLKTNNIIECTSRVHSATYTTFQIQTWDFTKAPKRSSKGDEVALTGISVGSPITIMKGESEAVAVSFAPANASDKGLVWSSNNEAVAKVDKYGIVTAVAATGSATITAKSTVNTSFTANQIVNVIPYVTTDVEKVEIIEGVSYEVPCYVTTPLTAIVLPLDATIQIVEWSSNNTDFVEVDPVTGKVYGKIIGSSAVITASVTDVNNGNTLFTDDITINVGISGEEKVYMESLVDEIAGHTKISIDIAGNYNGERSLTLELVQGASTVMGTSTVTIDTLGEAVIPVLLNMASIPLPGSDYKFIVTLKDGSDIVFKDESQVNVLDIIHVDSVGIHDWLKTVKIGETLQMSADVYPKNAYDTTVIWESMSPAVATVNANGLVTGISEGQSVIKAKTNDGGLESQVTIKVQSDDVVVTPEAINIKKEVSVFPEMTYKLLAELMPEWTTERELNWSSDNTSIVSVNDKGVVSAGKTEGSAVITVTSVSTPSVMATCTVHVRSKIFIEAEDFVKTGGSYDGFKTYTIDGEGAINWNQLGDWCDYSIDIFKAGTYSVSFFIGCPAENDQAGVKVYVDGVEQFDVAVPTGTSYDDFIEFSPTSGLIALSEGNHTIRIESSNVSEWQWNLEHVELSYYGTGAVEGISLSPKTITVGVGKTKEIMPLFTPAAAVNKNVTWSSENTSIATITDGTITGISKGTTKIVVKSEDGGFTDTVTVTVDEVSGIGAVEGISLSLKTITVGVGKTKEIMPLFTPATAVNKNVTWSSENTSIATITDGTITGISKGTTKIVVESEDGGFTDTATVTVEEVSGIGDINDSDVMIYPNPATEVFYIKGLKEEKVSVTIYNVQGLLLVSYDGVSSYNNSVSVSELESGTYVVVIENTNIKYVSRFQIE